MKTSFDTLEAHLKTLCPLYWLSSHEPLLLAESAKKIRLKAKENHIHEQLTFEINTHFNWQDFLLHSSNLSLFSERKLIELRFNTKLNAQLAEHIMHFLKKQTASEFDILIVITDKLEAATLKTAWFNTLIQQGFHLPLYPPTPQQFPAWIAGRLKAAGLSAEPDVISLLCERTQNNLLAAGQEIEKLALLFTNKTIRLDDLLQQSTEHGQYDVFALMEACLARNLKKVTKILAHLEQTGVEPPIVLWAISRDLRQFISVLEAIQLQGQNIQTAMRKAGVWENKHTVLQHFLKSCKLDSLYQSLQNAALIDQMIKGVKPGDPWAALRELCLMI